MMIFLGHFLEDLEAVLVRANGTCFLVQWGDILGNLGSTGAYRSVHDDIWLFLRLFRPMSEWRIALDLG